MWFIFFILQNVRIDTTFPLEYFEILESSLNGSYHHVRALKEGLTLIDATLKAVVDKVSLDAALTLDLLLLLQPTDTFFRFSREGSIISCAICSLSEWKCPSSRQPSTQ